MFKGVLVHWPFDQEKNVVAVTTVPVMQNGYPILSVVHYSDDASWAFLCGTTSASADLILATMESVIATDSSLLEIANLPLGWCATRSKIGDKWVTYQDDDI